MQWITGLPIGILYALCGLCALIICAFLSLALVTLLKGGRVKAGSVELDTEPEAPKSDLTPK
jgi:TRAP-type C4-dicarboxylate transport system permease small subunit